jgi:hypothetical protein
MTAPFAISFPASFLLFWMKVMPTMVCALDDVAFMFVLATVLQKIQQCLLFKTVKSRNCSANKKV